ncbi:hypothetical protein NUM3379_33570 [Kineococcus sp. NUM-3379]
MSSQSSAGSATGSHAPTGHGDHAPTGHAEHRALAPIRWRRPDRGTTLSMALWAVGLLIALVVPAILAPPEFGNTGDPGAGSVQPHGNPGISGLNIGLAMGATVLGSLIMLVSAYALHRRTGSIGAAILAFVPTFVVVVSGAIIATMLLLG